ncbi:Threonine--tRNA ligase 1 [compost metagenome]
MTYVDKDGKKQRPFVIHRSAIGSYERTLAMLIEKYAGAFPLWLAPTQIKVLPITDNQVDYANKVRDALQYEGFRVEVDSDSEKVGYKIRQAQLEKVPYMLVIGQKELDENVVAVRTRSGEDLGQIKLEDLVTKLNMEIKENLKK